MKEKKGEEIDRFDELFLPPPPPPPLGLFLDALDVAVAASDLAVEEACRAAAAASAVGEEGLLPMLEETLITLVSKGKVLIK